MSGTALTMDTENLASSYVVVLYVSVFFIYIGICCIGGVFYIFSKLKVILFFSSVIVISFIYLLVYPQKSTYDNIFSLLQVR
jgi:hypothetical protein